MSQQRLNRGIQNELRLLAAQGLVTSAKAALIAERYPVEPWNLLVLVRWLTVLGAVTAVAGMVVLARELTNTLRLIEVGLGTIFPALMALGAWLKNKKAMPRTGAVVELLGAMALHGLVVTLAIDFSTGSKNWPALVGICCGLMVVAAYGLRNRQVLILACVDFFIWFGGETGYMSGWGAYWLGMNFPLRFILVGLAVLGIGWAHATLLRGVYQEFSRVYIHLGLLVINLALWFFAVFGYFEEELSWSGNEGERIAFSALWAMVSLGSVLAANWIGQRAFRSYGMTFLVINIYTFYFQFVVAHSAELWWVHLLLTGGSLVALGVWLERRLRNRGAPGGNPSAGIGEGSSTG